MRDLVDGPVTVHVGDALSVLRQLASESVHCVVTSPPYWGLRDYGTAEWEGGEAGCDHVQSRALKRDTNGGLPPAGEGTRGTQSSTVSSVLLFRDLCGKCGARRLDSQLGLEPTPELYVEHMVEVFREVRRVLRRDGSCWLNLGDSYAAGKQGNDSFGDASSGLNNGRSGVGNKTGERMQTIQRKPPSGLKPKDLVGIPWRVAFALQADGWWLRSDIVWSKPNPMPESVTDRPTKSYEYVFLLTTSERYFYDQEAVKEAGGNRQGNGTPNGRNLRSVWTIATQPCPEAHFATFPEDLVIPCIKAGTSEHGVCPQCGSPWTRVVEREAGFEARRQYQDGLRGRRTGAAVGVDYRGVGVGRAETLGWQPTCAHDREPIPATVLDPFAGSGTTLAVARRLGRRSIGIELQPDYLPLIRKRVQAGALPLLELLQSEDEATI